VETLSNLQGPRCQHFELDHDNRIFRNNCTPHQHLSINSLVVTKTHTQLMYYLYNKCHHHWGVKFWVLCDSEPHFCLATFLYQGTKISEEKTEIQKYGSAHSVAVNVLQMSSKSYHFMDNCYYNAISTNLAYL
jgi:hypothetical protein